MPTLLSHRQALLNALVEIDAQRDRLGDAAAAMTTLLLNCANDPDGEGTLDALSAIFEDHDAVIDNGLERVFSDLTNAVQMEWGASDATEPKVLLRRAFNQVELVKAELESDDIDMASATAGVDNALGFLGLALTQLEHKEA